jgi:hypothetical protein
VKEEQLIYRILHGSHLYGTNTENSDQDYKEVYVPSGRSILLQRIKEGRASGPIKAASEKNKPDDIDTNSFAVTKLFSMITKGDIIGCELIFTPPQNILFKDPKYDVILQNRGIFLSRKIDGYVGYCRQQANKYGIRGSRVAAVRGLIDLLEDVGQGYTKISEIWPELIRYADETEHCEIEMIRNGATGDDMPHFVCCGKKQPITNPIKAAYDCYRKVFDEYGHRALAAERNEGIDWKAVSHACRVGQQALELLEDHTITFPRPNAADLLRIKRGEIVYQEVADYLDRLLLQVEKASRESTLPEKADQAKIDELIIQFHGEMIDRRHDVV